MEQILLGLVSSQVFKARFKAFYVLIELSRSEADKDMKLP